MTATTETTTPRLKARYREEIARHGPGVTALSATLRSAGTSVIFSAITVGAALAGRYATVSLLALAVGWLLVLAQTRRPWLRRAALIIGSFCCVGNLAVQAQALESVAWHNNGLRLGQLALSLGVTRVAW